MDGTKTLHQDSDVATAETSRGKSKSALIKGDRSRKRRKTILAKEKAGHAQKKAIDLRAAIEEEQNILPEQQKVTCYSDLLNIPRDWTAYESLFCDYFDD